MIERSHKAGRARLPASRDLPAKLSIRRSRVGQGARGVMWRRLRGNVDAIRLFNAFVREMPSAGVTVRYLCSEAALRAVAGDDVRSQSLLISALDVAMRAAKGTPKGERDIDVAARAERATQARRAAELAKSRSADTCRDTSTTEQPERGGT